MRVPRSRTAAPLAALAVIVLLAFAPAASAAMPKLKAHQRCEVIGGNASAGITYTGKGFTPGSLVDVTVSIESENPEAPGGIDSFVVVADAKGRLRGELFGSPPVIEATVTAVSIFEDESAAVTVTRPCDRPRSFKD